MKNKTNRLLAPYGCGSLLISRKNEQRFLLFGKKILLKNIPGTPWIRDTEKFIPDLQH
jgi:hypothetical protein